jgi:hypothetical protein
MNVFIYLYTKLYIQISGSCHIILHYTGNNLYENLIFFVIIHTLRPYITSFCGMMFIQS